MTASPTGRHRGGVSVQVTSVRRGGPADVVYILCLMQAAFLLLGAFGEMLLMGGNPLYLVMSTAKMVLLFTLATKVVSGRRWAMITLIVVQGITLVGFWLQLGAGLLPWVDFTVNLVGLMTNLAMPAAVISLCGLLLARRQPTPPRDPDATPATALMSGQGVR